MDRRFRNPQRVPAQSESTTCPGKVGIRTRERGQAAAELVFSIPVLLMLLFAAFQLARVFYVYHTLEKALRGGAGMLARASSVNYCDSADPALLDARNFIVYGNLQGTGSPVVAGLTPDLVQIFPERAVAGSTVVTECLCGEEESCDTAAGGHPPDYITINLGSGFPLEVPFPTVSFTTINLRVSVRMPVTGG